MTEAVMSPRARKSRFRAEANDLIVGYMDALGQTHAWVMASDISIFYKMERGGSTLVSNYLTEKHKRSGYEVTGIRRDRKSGGPFEFHILLTEQGDP